MQTLFDTDRHVAEPLNLWQQKLPAEYQAYAPEVRSENELHEIALRTAKYGPRGAIPMIPQTFVADQPLYNKFSEKARIEASHLVEQEPDRTQTAATAAGQLSSMDSMGIDVSFLFPGDAYDAAAFDLRYLPHHRCRQSRSP